jgi:hypothetical protein
MWEELSDSIVIDFGQSDCQQQSLHNYEFFHVLHVFQVPQENNQAIILQKVVEMLKAQKSSAGLLDIVAVVFFKNIEPFHFF